MLHRLFLLGLHKNHKHELCEKHEAAVALAKAHHHETMGTHTENSRRTPYDKAACELQIKNKYDQVLNYERKLKSP